MSTKRMSYYNLPTQKVTRGQQSPHANILAMNFGFIILENKITFEPSLSMTRFYYSYNIHTRPDSLELRFWKHQII
jgi:hypothetical protein